MVTKDSASGSESAATAADMYAKEDAEFQTIVTQRYMYNAEQCQATPLVGYLLNVLAMPPIVRGGKSRDWNAFLVKTTRPCKALNREKVLEDAPAGSEILIPATHELSQFFMKAATSPDKVFEVKIKPKTKLDIGDGQEMWLYDLGAKPQPTKRAAHGLAAVLAPLQLTAAGEGGAVESDMPF